MPVNLDELFALYDHVPMLFDALMAKENSGYHQLSELVGSIVQLRRQARKMKKLEIKLWHPTPELMNETCKSEELEGRPASADWRYTAQVSRSGLSGTTILEWKGVSLKELESRNRLSRTSAMVKAFAEKRPSPASEPDVSPTVGDLIISSEALIRQFSPTELLAYLDDPDHPLWMIYQFIRADIPQRFLDGDKKPEASFVLNVYPSPRLNLPEGIYSLAS
jgi:hypothetical protein